MDHWVRVGATSFLTAAICVPVARKLALRGKLLDIPNERSSHAIPKPRIGGVGIVLGALLGCAAAYGESTFSFSSKELLLLLLLAALSFVGLADDIWQLSVSKRMPLYLLFSFLLVLFCYRATSLQVLLFSWSLPTAVSIVFSTLFLAWYTNLFNFMDGVDGIAAGAAIVTLNALALVFFQNESQPLSYIALSLAGASAGFLFYNFPPASVFMGDVGSVFLGAASGALTLAAIELNYLSIVAGVLLMFPFVFDASFTLARRALNGEKVWRAHRSHIYQQMGDLGISHRVVTLSYSVLAFLCAAFGLLYDSMTLRGQLGGLTLLIALSGGGAFLVLSRARANHS